MLRLRLTRTGAKKRPSYRIVAIDQRSARDGRPVEYLGTFDPRTQPERIVLDSERIEAWLARGAQPTPAVRSILRRARRQAASGG